MGLPPRRLSEEPGLPRGGLQSRAVLLFGAWCVLSFYRCSRRDVLGLSSSPHPHRPLPDRVARDTSRSHRLSNAALELRRRNRRWCLTTLYRPSREGPVTQSGR